MTKSFVIFRVACLCRHGDAMVTSISSDWSVLLTQRHFLHTQTIASRLLRAYDCRAVMSVFSVIAQRCNAVFFNVLTRICNQVSEVKIFKEKLNKRCLFKKYMKSVNMLKLLWNILLIVCYGEMQDTFPLCLSLLLSFSDFCILLKNVVYSKKINNLNHVFWAKYDFFLLKFSKNWPCS